MTSYQTHYKTGQDNIRWMGLDIHNPVFFVSALLIIAFVAFTLILPDLANSALTSAKSWSIEYFDWLFMLSGNLFLVFCLLLMVLPVGRIRLGGEQAKPEFSRLSWLAMLFAAGMGIGLMFWSVAEPVAYYTDWYGTPLNVTANTEQAAHTAMGATLFHWGLHPWAIYGLVGLSLAFFTYNKQLPLTIRSTFYPILGERVWGRTGDLIDILAVLATIFGLATSLGLGAQQASAGIQYLFDIEADLTLQIMIIAVVTFVAVISVVRGLDGGVKRLSQLNIALAFLLMLAVAILGLSWTLPETIAKAFVDYATHILPLSNWVGREDNSWFHGWTVFYWAWWISWSPFVGMFIARISKGRTVREFLLAVLFIPTLVTIIWMSVFGGLALSQVIQKAGALSQGITDASLSMFQMLATLPFAEFTSLLAILLVLTFFVTSSDSGSLVIDGITSGGKLEAPVPQRIFWATLEGCIAAVLLYSGGKQALTALQAGAITTALPFTLILLVMCYSLFKGLNSER